MVLFSPVIFCWRFYDNFENIDFFRSDVFKWWVQPTFADRSRELASFASSILIYNQKMSSAAVVGRKKKHGEKKRGGRTRLFDNLAQSLLCFIIEYSRNAIVTRPRLSLTAYQLPFRSQQCQVITAKPCTKAVHVRFSPMISNSFCPTDFSVTLSPWSRDGQTKSRDSEFGFRFPLSEKSPFDVWYARRIVLLSWRVVQTSQIKKPSRQGKNKKKNIFTLNKNTHTLYESGTDCLSYLLTVPSSCLSAANATSVE